MHLVRTALVVALAAPLPLVATAPAHAAAGKQYRVVELGSLGGINGQSFAVNNRDQVVGASTTAAGQYHPFVWTDGVMTDLGTLGPGLDAVASDINDLGQIIGSGTTPAGDGQHAILWDRGVMTDLGTLGGRTSTATSINNRGQILGYSENSAGQWHAFLWQRGVMTDLGLDQPADMNDLGHIVGYDYLWRNGHITTIGGLSPDTINNRGWIVGGGAKLWRAGVTTELVPGNVEYSQAVALNDRGQVLCRSVNPSTWQHQWFSWQNGVLTDLAGRGIASQHDLVDVNERGHIAGTLVFAMGDPARPVLFV